MGQMEALSRSYDIDDSQISHWNHSRLYLLHTDLASIDRLVNGGSDQGPMQKVHHQDALQVFRLSVPIIHKWQSDNLALLERARR